MSATTRHPVPLLLAPGMLLNRDLFAAQVSDLADVADCIVAEEAMQAVSLPAMATALLAAAPERFALAGMSMGGYVAQEVMRQQPQRVAGLALISTGARPDPPAGRAQREALIRQAGYGEFQGISRALFAHWVHPDRVRDEALYQRVRAMTRAAGADTFVRQQRANLDRIDLRPYLPQVSCPAIVICGREDAITPLHLSKEMAAAIPGAQLAVIEQCGHLSPLEQPAAVSAALRGWLARLP